MRCVQFSNGFQSEKFDEFSYHSFDSKIHSEFLFDKQYSQLQKNFCFQSPKYIPQWFPNCTETYKNELRAMQECCEIYTLSYSWDQRHECATYCIQEDISECCYDQCFASTYQLWSPDNRTVMNQNILMAITKNNSIDSDLITIVDNSLKTCSEEMLKQPSSYFATEHCEMNITLYWMTACILKQNYMNCPNVTEEAECKGHLENIDCFGKTTTKATKPPKTKGSKSSDKKKTTKTKKSK